MTFKKQVRIFLANMKFLILQTLLIKSNSDWWKTLEKDNYFGCKQFNEKSTMQRACGSNTRMLPSEFGAPRMR